MPTPTSHGILESVEIAELSRHEASNRAITAGTSRDGLVAAGYQDAPSRYEIKPDQF